jgi:3-methylcrotonyl-CoA carboxylase alpha subunit
MFDTVLIANRGEIAVRIAQTARRLGLRIVAIYSDADRDAMHVAAADEAFRIGPAPARDSYLRADAILEAARKGGAQAIHPGYGFLSESPDFVEAVEAAGLTFVGPPASAIRAMGLKDAAKALMDRAGVPTVPGYHGGDQAPATLAEQAGRIGYPVLIKASAGGGGKGMRRVDREEDFADALAGAKREAQSSFGDDRVLVERLLVRPRHIEIQVFADAHGDAVHLFERDCSLQRRHQKVIEEAPAPGMLPAMREAMGQAAVKAARAVGYRGAGTVEFIADVSDGLRADRFYFMEMNTRLQVEHPVTELITGLDLVEWQFRIAAGEPLPKRQDELEISGHAVEARLYAEDPAQDFLPQTGRLTGLTLADGAGVRVDAGVRPGDLITPFYDPMIAKVIAHGPSRDVALGRLRSALSRSRVEGCGSNLVFLTRLLDQADFRRGDVDTGLIGRNLASLTEEPEPPPTVVALAAIEAAGLLSPPSSNDPFDRLRSFRLWGEAEKSVTLIDRGRKRTLATAALPDGTMRVDAGTETVILRRTGTDGGSLLVDLGDRLERLQVSRDDDAVTVRTDADTYRFTLPDAEVGAAEGGASSGILRAVMPGAVRVVHVAAGQTVARGDALVVTEAMKMEMTLTAPRAGRVAAVEVAAGDQVEANAVLLTIEAPDP